jgi:hypothetical protein
MKTQTIELFGRRIELVGNQIDVFASILAGPKTVAQIIQETGIIDQNVRSALKSLWCRKGCIKEVGRVPVTGRPIQIIWGIGEDEEMKKVMDAKKHQKSLLTEAKIKANLERSLANEKLELKKKFAENTNYLKMHLTKQHTAFGWLLELR